MAAPKNNQFWRLRSKHGRNKLFASPELLWETACEYFEWCDNNPWINSRIKRKETVTEEEESPTQRPYTLSGLCLYLDASKEFWREFKKGEHKDFFGVISRIEEIIETQQFEGAVVGAFNANIIARKLGLADKKEHTGANGESLFGNVPLTKDDLIKRKKEIEESI